MTSETEKKKTSGWNWLSTITPLGVLIGALAFGFSVGYAVRTASVDSLQSEIRRIQAERDQIRLEYVVSRVQTAGVSTLTSEVAATPTKVTPPPSPTKATPPPSPIQTTTLAKRVEIRNEDTVFFDAVLFVSVQGISFEGSPLVHRANLKAAVRGGEEKILIKGLPGDVLIIQSPAGSYEVRILRIDTISVEVQVFGPMTP